MTASASSSCFVRSPACLLPFTRETAFASFPLLPPRPFAPHLFLFQKPWEERVFNMICVLWLREDNQLPDTCFSGGLALEIRRECGRKKSPCCINRSLSFRATEPTGTSRSDGHQVEELEGKATREEERKFVGCVWNTSRKRCHRYVIIRQLQRLPRFLRRQSKRSRKLKYRVR